MENSKTVLYSGDIVILLSNGEFYKFTDGEVVIYPSLTEAHKDRKGLIGASTCSCHWLPIEKKRELIENIEKFKRK